MAHLLEDGDEVFVAGRDLLVRLKAALLQNAVERVRLVDDFSATMHKREDLETDDVDLVNLLWLLLVFELGREEDLAQLAVRVLQGLPSRRCQLLAQSFQGHVASVTTFLLRFVNLG